jgi:hypothetical protein
MALEKKEVVDLIEVLENGCVQIRTKIAILENDVEISSKFHRHVVVPGDDYAKEDARVQVICKSTHTANVIKDYKASQVVK